MTISRALAVAGLGLCTFCVPTACGGSSQSRRETTVDAGGGGSDGSDGTGGASGAPVATGCTEQSDGCLVGQILNADPNPPYDPTNPNRDGHGTFYVALLDTCPDANTTTYAELSETVSVEVDLLDANFADEFELGFQFGSSDYAQPIEAGDTAVLVGFLDDDGSSAGASIPMPNVGDTITNCIEVELRAGTNGLTMPLAPCFYYALPEPYVFDQSSLSADCSIYADVLGAGGAGAGGAGNP